MSHGNSGFLIFCERRKLEGPAYPDVNAYANAWCHGAAGILLSRLKLAEMKQFEKNAVVSEDIANAARVLFSQSARKGLCLCHGMAGNYWIMTEYAKTFRLDQEQNMAMRSVRGRILCQAADWGTMLPQDRENPGMMMGIAGIGSVLVEMESERQDKILKN